MDPLTIGFERAIHAANAAPEDSPGAVRDLASQLVSVIEASPHRVRGAVRAVVDEAGRIELERDGESHLLERKSGRWRLRGSHEPSFSGPVAVALTEWLTSRPPPR